jgi:hypothetical protein
MPSHIDIRRLARTLDVLGKKEEAAKANERFKDV